jgi:hypothetical protein
VVLWRKLRNLERAAEGEMIIVPQLDGTVKRYPQTAGEEAFVNLMDRMGAGEDAPPEHPLIAAARNSSGPRWANSIYAVEGARWTEQVEDLSE